MEALPKWTEPQGAAKAAFLWNRLKHLIAAVEAGDQAESLRIARGGEPGGPRP